MPLTKIPDDFLRGFERCILRSWKGSHIRWHTSNIYEQPEILTIFIHCLLLSLGALFESLVRGLQTEKAPIILTSKISSFSPLFLNTEGFHSQALAIITLLAPLSFQNFFIPLYVFATLSRLLLLPPLAITGIVAY